MIIAIGGLFWLPFAPPLAAAALCFAYLCRVFSWHTCFWLVDVLRLWDHSASQRSELLGSNDPASNFCTASCVLLLDLACTSDLVSASPLCHRRKVALLADVFLLSSSLVSFAKRPLEH